MQCGPGCVCVWPPPLQRQLAVTPRRRHSIVNFHFTGTKSGNCGSRAFTVALLFGRRTDVHRRHCLQSEWAADVGEITSSQVETRNPNRSVTTEDCRPAAMLVTPALPCFTVGTEAPARDSRGVGLRATPAVLRDSTGRWQRPRSRSGGKRKPCDQVGRELLTERPVGHAD